MKAIKIFLFFLLGAKIVLFLYSCSSSAQANENPVNKIDASFISIDTATVRDVKCELKLTGKVTFNQDKVIKIYPQVSGRVANVKVELGDYVQKDQVLAVLQSSDIASNQQQFEIAQSNVQIAQKNLDVANDMFKSGITSEKELITAKNELAKAQSELNRTRELMKIIPSDNKSQYIIKAPISGFIVEKKINNEMQIRSDFQDNLFTISNLNDVWVEANVYPIDISKVDVGYKAIITTISYPDKEFTGKVDKIYNVLDPVSKVMKIRIKLDNEHYKLKPEMFADIMIQYSENKKLPVVASNSVIFDNSKNYVVVSKGNTNYEVREVQIYKELNNIAYISSGIKEGDKIVSKNSLLTYDALVN